MLKDSTGRGLLRSWGSATPVPGHLHFQRPLLHLPLAPAGFDLGAKGSATSQAPVALRETSPPRAWSPRGLGTEQLGKLRQWHKCPHPEELSTHGAGLRQRCWLNLQPCCSKAWYTDRFPSVSSPNKMLQFPPATATADSFSLK